MGLECVKTRNLTDFPRKTQFLSVKVADIAIIFAWLIPLKNIKMLPNSNKGLPYLRKIASNS